MENLSWDEWTRVFDDYDFFSSIIESIFDEHSLGQIEYHENLTPGTNAVFRVNDYVVKIYVPLETKDWDENDYLIETSLMKEERINSFVPKIIATGSLVSNQTWDYIVMEYVDSDELGYVYFDLSIEEKKDVLDQLREFLNVFHIKEVENNTVINRGLTSRRWIGFEKRLMNEISDFVSSRKFDFYRVHGDLTKDNILYDETIQVIDFADSVAAPKCYEYPPLAFDLFEYDLETLQDLFKESYPVLIENILMGLFIHDFGGDYLTNILKRLHITKREILSVDDVRNCLIDIIK